MPDSSCNPVDWVTLRDRKGFDHPVFGDLNRVDAVETRYESPHHFNIRERTPYYIHLSITGKCYARCKGCVNSNVTAHFAGDRNDFVPIADTDAERDAACIINLARKNGPGDVIVCFYGGEPFMAVDKMNHVYQVLNHSILKHRFKYMVYTSGELIKKAVPKYSELISNVWLYAVSIDGTQQQHEKFRPGTNLTRIHDSLAALNNVRKGCVLMWSTLREDQSLKDCFDEFMWLKKRGRADQFFWHWVEAEAPFNAFDRYLTRYERELVEVLDVYLKWLNEGMILPVTHINELIIYMLSGKQRNASACNVEMAMNYDLIDGKIHSCADLPIELAVGYVKNDGTPVVRNQDLTFLVDYKKGLNCYACGVHSYCGGRCPVQAFTSGFVRMNQYCQLMRLHVGLVRNYMDDILAAMNKNQIGLQDLYDQSAFYNQFTDVTP